MPLNLRFPVALKHSLAPTFVLIIVICAYFVPMSFSELFVYQREGISQFELWRLFSGHFFHTNLAHLLLNTSAIVLLWSLHGQFYSIKHYFLLLVICGLVVSSGLYAFSPQLEQYVGLSGILHGVFAWGAIWDIKHQDKTGYLLFVGLWLKVVYEQVFGASQDISQLIDASVAIDAHLWGAIAGSSIAFIQLSATRIFNK